MILKIIFFFILQICLYYSQTYYEILEIQPQSSDYQIKKSFRRLSMKYHPDKNKSAEAKQKFQQINTAYEILKDRTLRKIYDSQGEKGVQQHLQNRIPGSNTDPLDFYSTRKNIERRGPQLRIKLQVTLEDIYNGNEILVYVTKQTICPHCRGLGANSPNDVKVCPQCNGQGNFIRKQQIAPGYYQQYQHQCEKCGGKGRIVTSVCPTCRGQKSVEGHDELLIKIPKGILSGEYIVHKKEIKIQYIFIFIQKFEGAGDEYFDSSPSDVFFEIQEISHPKFTRKGYDLYYKLEISLKEALLGFKKKIQHLGDNYVKIERNQITSPGFIERIVNQGMPIRNYQGRSGDLYIEYYVRFDNYYSQEKIECKFLFQRKIYFFFIFLFFQY
ncbi:hypothetical protein IMG5_129010 [Ichthyophthirius multifiliis]|uniref:Uncharacterized protein n=1 Tax=Ichthyophthirius multifiliis TaxID=5932 RepID=G0QW31_ICHMU|nr:hypothetical protein IMG5_129010 [Ichthyophthirius multifiliis]EGR30568.1 hypothetical protein IMG5_129010 [Ichthyophthirius multifiliis]|eukprot:XP_004032155.1 hypothetical protein IMG5_129010 [Ichthyophthirius multifiliis]